MTDNTTNVRIVCAHICRYPYTIECDGGTAIDSIADKSGGMDTAIDFALQVQIPDGDIAYIAEKRTRFTVIAPNVSGSYRMTIAVESTTIGSV